MCVCMCVCVCVCGIIMIIIRLISDMIATLHPGRVSSSLHPRRRCPDHVITSPRYLVLPSWGGDMECVVGVVFHCFISISISVDILILVLIILILMLILRVPRNIPG